MPRFAVRVVIAVCGSALLSTASALEAQTYRGTVVAAESGEPIEGAILRGSRGGYVDVTLDDGMFEFVIPSYHRPLEVVVSRTGYATETFFLDAPSRELVLELARAPIELEGVTADVSLERRLEELEDALDARYAPHRGVFRSADREMIRTFDEAHEGDPYAMLTGALDLYFDFSAESDALRLRQGRRMQFEVFVDDARVSLLAMIGVPNDQICRAEMFHTVMVLGRDPYREPTPQLRIYTCSFMARVASGHEELADRVCWNELVAWRAPTMIPSGCTYRR